MSLIATRWPPRLARLYGEDVKRLEAKHADRLFAGACTWAEAVDALYRRVVDAGPAKGTKLLKQAGGYLNNVVGGERAHLVLACNSGSRNAQLVFATFSLGNHPDPRVQEEGLNIDLHVVLCSRAQPRAAIGVPVAFVSHHAVKRLYEHGHDITENSHASSALAFLSVLGFLTHRSAKHVGGGLYLRFSGLLAAGALHSFPKVWPNGHTLQECVYDVRTMLPADEIGAARRHQLAQGELAAQAVIEWFENADDLDESALAEAIPALPRREDHYPARAAARNSP